MIFLTVGGQLPFDRLVNALDEIAPQLGEPVFAQVGKSEIKPTNFEAVQFLRPDEFHERFRNARTVVAHAGIGTILTAKQLGKPVILMPRLAALGEHRNDHQLATVVQLGSIKGVYIAQDATQLLALLKRDDLVVSDDELSQNRASLVTFLQAQVQEVAKMRGRALTTGFLPEPTADATGQQRMFLFVTANNEPGSLSKLETMLASVAAFVAQGAEPPVKLHLLLQNATPEVSTALQAKLPAFVHLHALDRRISLSRARNMLLGAPEVLGQIGPQDIVGFPDDDCWFPAGTLEHIATVFRTLPDLDFWFCRYGTDAASPRAEPKMDPPLQQVIAKASSNTMYFRGRVVRAIGDFDEALGVGAAINGGEDTDYALRAFHAARRTAFLDEKVVGHRDFDPKLKARYYPGSLVAILRHARKSPAGLIAAGRKFLVGCLLVCQRKLALRDFYKTLKYI